MIIGARLHENKAKTKKDSNNDTFRPMQNPGTPEDHKYMTSHLNLTNKHDQRTNKQGNIYPNKQNKRINNPYKKNL